MNPDALEKIHAFLAAHSTLSLATVNVAGLPEVAPLLYVTDDETLIWISGPRSRHSHNIGLNRRAAVAIHNEVWTWDEIAGVQMEGEVNLIPLGPSREHAWELYKTKFPAVVEFETDLSTSEFYRFVPTWIRLIDHTTHFGYHEEVTLG